MKKIICLFAVLSAMIMTSCSDDDNTIPEKSKLYEIQIDNRMAYEEVSQKSDANLYDINLMSSNGEVYSLGSVEGGKAKIFSLPKSHSDLNVLVMACKIGRNRSEAQKAFYLCPEISRGTVRPIFVKDGELTTITIFSNTTWSQMKYSTIDELKEFAKEIASELSSK